MLRIGPCIAAAILPLIRMVRCTVVLACSRHNNAKRREIFWYRYFGVNCSSVPIHMFCEALWLHLSLEYELALPNLQLFTRFMVNVIGM